MSVANAVPEYWAAGLKEKLIQTDVWRAVPDDRSSEVQKSPGGNKLHINMYSGAVSVSDYERYNAITTGDTRTVPRGAQPKTTDSVMTLDQQKLVLMEFDDLDHVQANPQLFARHTLEGVRKLNFAFNGHLRTQNALDLPAAQITAQNGYSATGDGEQGKFRAAVIDWIFDIALKADRGHWPMNMRGIVGTPEFKETIIKYMTIDKPNMGAGQVIDEAWVNYAFAKILGMNLIMDDSMDAVADSSVMAHAVVMGPESGLVLAEQFTEFEAFRSQAFVGDVVRGLHVYEAKRVVDDRTYILNHGTLLTAAD